MSKHSKTVLISSLILALAGCDARTDAGGASGAGGEGEARGAGGATTAAQAPAGATAAAASQPEACVTGLLQTARFAGGWNVRDGEAWFGGHSTRTGTNDITLRASGNDLTMTITGFPTVRMQRVPRVANYSAERDTFRWQHDRVDPEIDPEHDPDAAVSSDEAVLVFGCENMNEMARFQGQARIDADGMSGMATFRLVMTGTDDGILHWEMPAPMASSGLFNIERVT
ncbi:hypothetical protein [Brevundimonas aveniformis]|mgnify:CR=1 FL=1|uniref:hypothetical protein n=1 Tax=Brevundimonas aveniformis TaxID=370977 RepID=UPI00248F9AC6|nr:hypothetical protein [Brevundimonas aveniformis]